jgi:hypothetical protein
LRAYYVGHLGKYVPGKAMVIVIRAALMHRARVPAAIAATSTVYETLTTMAVGSLVAGVVLLTASTGMAAWTRLAAILLLVAGLPIVPAVFNQMLRWLSVPLRQADPIQVSGLGPASLLMGVLFLACGWITTGLGLGATLEGIGAPNTPSSAGALGGVPLWIAGASLAIVAGFLAVWFPGGLGVREGVLVSILQPAVGPAAAVGAAVVWRFVSIASEAAAAAALYLFVGKTRGCEPAPSRSQDNNRP